MKYSLALALALLTQAQAATIAVVDSGVDYLHQQLAHKMWLNPIIEYKGEFPRAINGWNFIDKNNEIFDHSHIDSFPDDVFRYFEVEARYNAGTLTAEDRKFISERLTDEEFYAKISAYGGYAHGTHVAGIATKNTDHEIIGLKYIATSLSSILDHLRSSKSSKKMTAEETFHYYLAYIAQAQGDNFAAVGRFLEKHVADVMNGSYGAAFKQIQRISDTVYREVYQKSPNADESYKSAYILQYFVLESYKKTLEKNKNTLFVFAAGNDSSNNDLYPASPANLNVENSITVAATHGTHSLAKFSNYGAKTVDVAAPGVNIYSAAPGTNNVPMSGTSQAAPFVSRVAGKIKDANPRLTPAQIKQILMETVDKKSFLKNKVKSEGIVNEQRAVRAAELSRNLTLTRAIYQANVQISQSAKSFIPFRSPVEDLRFVELPSTFTE